MGTGLLEQYLFAGSLAVIAIPVMKTVASEPC